jgi:DNA-binding CsgD family transcriptional regulator
VLELLQPHLQQRYDRVCAAAAASDALAELDSDDPRHIVLCSSTGAIEFASPESRSLLAKHLDRANGHVPDVVLRRITFATTPRDGNRLTVRSTGSGELYVVLLSEEDVRLERLTPRQRQVVEHVACGETDAQIAAALGIAPATVNKHLEQIYERLGVHTRTAAAALVR